LIPPSIQPSLRAVTRFLLAILLAISMAATSGPAFAAPAADCPMGGGMVDHSKMGCCPPICAVTCLPAVLDDAAVDVPTVEPSSIPATALAPVALPSVTPAATDPPPRITLS